MIVYPVVRLRSEEPLGAFWFIALSAKADQGDFFDGLDRLVHILPKTYK